MALRLETEFKAVLEDLHGGDRSRIEMVRSLAFSRNGNFSNIRSYKR